MQSDLLGDVRLGQHVPGQLCWQIREVAHSKEMDWLTTARARSCPGKLLQIWGVGLGGHLFLPLLQPLQGSGPWHFDF